MKPTVIASGSSENAPSHPGGNNVNPAGKNIGPNNEGGASANAHANVRHFPQFQTEFGFDPDVDDIFSDAGLRSRLSRFRDPFSFARKRCGNNDTNADPYSRYFDDETDFFPNFGSLPGRRRTGSHGNTIFERIPSEFRHYIPDGFGIPQTRTAPQTAHAAQQATPQQHPQQYYETYVQPPSPTYAQPPQQKPKLCDAAIQTEDLSENNESKEGKNLKQYGMRNTVDLGQKSPLEECRGPRSQSAPPADAAEQNPSTYSTAPNSAPQEAFATATAYAHASASPSKTQEPQQAFTQQRTQGTQPMTPPQPPLRQHFPNPQEQYQPWNQQQQKPQYQQPPPQQQSGSPSGSGFIRTVPIFVEGRSEPVVTKTTVPPQQQSPRHPQQQQQPRQKPAHPTPLNTQQTPPPSNQVPPQTPHTAECISKIQAIQRDVLDLMTKVENFKGMRNDKEYMYLDEMLTRNLLKLDTIDTNGKDSIRLARREAIKCIQASINVLDAKAEENAKTAQQTVMEAPTENKAEEKADENTKNEENVENENVNIPLDKIAIPLPPPPEKKENQSEPEEPKQNSEVKNEESQKEGVEVTKSEEMQQVPDTEKIENSQAETVKKSIPETGTEITDKNPTETEPETDSANLKKPEEGTEVPKSTGAVKKKIIKKKKPASDKKDKSKSESTSPQSAETPPENAVKPAERSEPGQEPSQP